MLNRVILMGRITQDLDLRTTSSGVSVLTFNIAVDRGYVKQGEERQSDFITCVAWRQQAEFINRYFAKGRMIALEGSLRSRTYDDKNGTKHYVTEVFVDNVSFTGERATQGGESNYASNSNYKARTPEAGYKEPANNQSLSIGGFDDFEEILSDDGVPF
ncbi:MAG: single-stranded DNA-binding protein [Oscillospiraceae bacterium]|nr:single-stranded DNA-binding protein [Oscillospiraceae bacterium]